jgi:hypothetical protein
LGGARVVVLNFAEMSKEKFKADGTLDKRPALNTLNDGAGSTGATFNGTVQKDMIRTPP